MRILQRPNSSLIKPYIAIILLNIFILTLLFFMFPEIQTALVAEDYFLETATAVIFLIAFFISVYCLYEIQEYQIPWEHILIPILALVFFLDEVGFGLRLFLGIEYFYLNLGPGFKIDGIHDIFGIIHFVIERLEVNIGNPTLFLIVMILSIASVILILVALNRRYKLYDRFKQWLPHHVPFMVFFCGIIVFFGLAFPLDYFFSEESIISQFFEEVFEESAAISTLFCAFYLLRYPDKQLREKE